MVTLRNSFQQATSCVVAAFLFLGLAGGVSAQKKHASATGASPVLIKTNKENVTLDEFEKAYKRMNDKDPYASSLDSLKDFLVIYGDYRLKLMDAKAQGLDKDEKIIKEMDGYRKLLAGPFVLDKLLTEPAIEKMYERRRYEVNAAHFLAQVHNWNNPKDTLQAYTRAMTALQRLRGGEPLAMIVMSDRQRKWAESPAKARREEMQQAGKNAPADSNAWQGSDDRNSINLGGSLGWFTGGMTIRPFEDAVYSLQPGEYVQYPVRTKFGYHVVYLIDKRLRLGGIKVHHILVSMPRNVKDEDTLKYYQKADSLLHAIKAGAKFETVAVESSDDKGSSGNGGDLGAIDHEQKRTEPAFDDAAYMLKDGEMSGIIRTSKGYHIIRRDGIIPAKSFAEEKDFLKKLYKQYYFNEDRDKLLAATSKQLNLHVDSSSINIFMSRVDSSRTSVDSNWAAKITPGELHLPIYTMGGASWYISSLVDSLNSQKGYPLARNQINDFVTRQIDEDVMNYLSKDVETKYPEFDQIMADYKNGIMLFELENRKVWGAIKPDSLAELKFYNEHKTRFMWPERIDVSEIYVLSDTLAKSLYKRIRDNGENFDSLAAKYTERPGYKEKAGHWGLLIKDENELSRKSFSLAVDDVCQPFSNQAGYSIVKMNRRVPLTQKSFQEARQEVASQYQDEMSNELRLKWVEELRTKYKRDINNAALEAAVKAHSAANAQTN
ncbi:MAG: peptidylprolyl isomerase [Bacteroidetes bacterium]|nr:peptidylprolyl isomerase [Bacteroidota bacterium]